AAHLGRHPHDVLAARVALRSPAAAEVETMELAGTVLAGFAGADSNNWDQALLRLRAARSLLARSWRAARNVPGAEDPRAMARELTRRRFRRTETDAALADVARMASRAGDARTRDDALAVL